MDRLTNSGLQIFSKQINEAVSALIELEAMKAENKQRESLGESMAYSHEQIIKLQESNRLGYNDIIEKYREYEYCL